MVRKVAKTIDQIEQQEAQDNSISTQIVHQVQDMDYERGTPKELVLEMDATGFYRFAYPGGGRVPDELLGLWTNMQRAQAMKAAYLNKQALDKVGQ